MDLRSCLTAALVLAVGCSSATTSPTPSSGAPAPSSTTTSPTEGVPPPGDPVKPTAFSEAEVQQLFDSRCLKCHDSSSNKGALVLKPFATGTVGVATGGRSCAQATDYVVRIAPGNRQASLLWHKVNGTADCGAEMPPADSGIKKLDATELERLGLFIDGLPKK